MLNLELIGADKIAQSLDKMIVKIDYVSKYGLRQTLNEWQADDLHRKQPFLTGSKRARKRAQTIIRPHSVYEMKRSQRNVVRARRRRRPSPHRSTRPILRAELLTKLAARVHELANLLKWTK